MERKAKSMKKVKAEGTQEFFSKAKTKFTFNKAPINKDDAKMAAKDKFVDRAEKDESVLAERSKGKKRSAFVAKLYRDDDDLDEMKVLAGDEFDSDIDEATERKRDKKQREKSVIKTDAETEGIKISKLVSQLIHELIYHSALKKGVLRCLQFLKCIRINTRS